eukprot:688320-Alexandrium_andersonii.AAC.1
MALGFNLELNGGGHKKALRSFGTRGDDKRAWLFLTRQAIDTDPDATILEAVRYQMRVRRGKFPLLGW